jgi:hypothetical protein
MVEMETGVESSARRHSSRNELTAAASLDKRMQRRRRRPPGTLSLGIGQTSKTAASS